MEKEIKINLTLHVTLISRIGRIHRLHLFRGVKKTHPGRYDIRQSDSEAPGLLEHWGVQSTPSLSSGPLQPGIVAPDGVQSMGQIELFCIHKIVGDHSRGESEGSLLNSYYAKV